jgi:hypothetical protein
VHEARERDRDVLRIAGIGLFEHTGTLPREEPAQAHSGLRPVIGAMSSAPSHPPDTFSLSRPHPLPMQPMSHSTGVVHRALSSSPVVSGAVPTVG